MDTGNSKTWHAVLTPHRSLSKQGFLVVMGLVVLVNLTIGGLFAALGAWPIAGFAGLDVLLVWWAFQANFSDARQQERISIADHEVVLERLREDRPAVQCRFVRRWVRVELQEDRERELIGRLCLVSGQTRETIGEFLAPDERKTLAIALRQALAIPRI